MSTTNQNKKQKTNNTNNQNNNKQPQRNKLRKNHPPKFVGGLIAKTDTSVTSLVINNGYVDDTLVILPPVGKEDIKNVYDVEGFDMTHMMRDNLNLRLLTLPRITLNTEYKSRNELNRFYMASETIPSPMRAFATPSRAVSVFSTVERRTVDIRSGDITSVFDESVDAKWLAIPVYNTTSLLRRQNRRKDDYWFGRCTTFTHMRKDGKVLHLHAYATNYPPPQIEYVPIEAACELIEHYMSFCATRYWREVAVDNYIAGEDRFASFYDAYTMVMSNYIVRNAMDRIGPATTHLNFVYYNQGVARYCEMGSFLLQGGCEWIIGNVMCVQKTVSAPISSRAFDKWDEGPFHAWKKTRHVNRGDIYISKHGVLSHAARSSVIIDSIKYLNHYVSRMPTENLYLPPKLRKDVRESDIVATCIALVHLMNPNLSIESTRLEPNHIYNPASTTEEMVKIYGSGNIAEEIPNLPLYRTSNYGIAHIYRNIVIYGLCPRESRASSVTAFRNWPIRDELKIPVCPVCWDYLLRDRTILRPLMCCLKGVVVKKKLHEFVMEHYHNTHTFNFWIQKIFRITDRDWDPFYWFTNRWYNIHHTPFWHNWFKLGTAEPTMFSAISNINKISDEVVKGNLVHKFSDITDRLHHSIPSLLQKTEQAVNNINEAMPKLSQAAASVSKTFNVGDDLSGGLDEIISSVEKYINDRIMVILRTIFPFLQTNDVITPNFTKMLRNIILMRHVENTLVKGIILIDMLRHAKLLDPLYKFYVNYMTMDSEQGGVTAGDDPDLNTWLDWFITSPAKIFNNAKALIAGFVGIVTTFNVKDLFSYISGYGNVFRSIITLDRGTTAMSNIFWNMRKCYYIAKEYICKKLGLNCFLPLDINYAKRITSWIHCVSVVTAPAYRNTVVTSDNLITKVEELWKLGLKLSITPKVDRPMLGAFNVQMESLKKLRCHITLVNGINPSVFVPLVIHLNGPVKIGKSALCSKLIKVLAAAMGIPGRIYTYNEGLRFFDGYASQDVIICDDVNLFNDAEKAAWMIKVVSPNACVLPTAENDLRPSMSNVKLIILTSNTPYSVATCVATSDGIDRRSEYKFEVSSPHYVAGVGINSTSMKTAKQDWNTCHIFKRIAAIRSGILPEEEQFEGGTTKFVSWIRKRAVEYVKAEKLRVVSGTDKYRFGAQEKILREGLFEGLTAGMEVLSPEALAIEMKNITFETTDSWLTSVEEVEAGPTTLDKQDALSVVSAIPTADSDIEWMYLFNSPATPLTDPNFYPRRCVNRGEIVFDAPYSDHYEEGDFDTDSTDKVAYTTATGTHHFDNYFLSLIHHRTSQGSTVWYMTDFYERDPNNFVTPIAERDAITADTLIRIQHDIQFMDSLVRFHRDLTEEQRMEVWNSANTFVESVAMFNTTRIGWRQRMSEWLSRRTLANDGTKILIGVYASCCALVLAGCTIGIMTDLLDYNYKKKMYRELDGPVKNNSYTSQAPRVPNKGATGISKTNWCSDKQSTNYSHARDRAISNLAVARFVNTRGNEIGRFSIVGLNGKFTLLPHHALVGELPRMTHDKNYYEIQVFAPNLPIPSWVPHWFHKDAVLRIQGTDAAIVAIETIRPWRDLLRHWHDGYVGDSSAGAEVEVLYRTHDTVSARLGQFRHHCSRVDVELGNNQTLTYLDQYAVDADVPKGSSGGPVLINDNSYQAKIIGIQSSRRKYAFVQGLTRSQLSGAMSNLQVNLDVFLNPAADVEYEEKVDITDLCMLGVVAPKDAVTISSKTELKRTPWFGLVMEPPTKKPVFSTTNRADLYDFTAKTELVSPLPFDPSVLRETVLEYSELLRSYMVTARGRMVGTSLTVEQAVSGNYLGGKPLDLNTSPGIGTENWIRNRTLKGQKDFIRLNDDGTRTILPIVYHAVNGLNARCLTKAPNTSTYAAFPKDELREAGKAARGIDGAPLEQKIYYRMIYGAIDGALAHINQGHMVYGPGIDLFSESGTNLISRMTTNLAMWDFKTFDGSVTLQLYEAVASVYNILSNHDGYSTARLALANITCCANIVADDKIYQPNKGMRSGFGGTAAFNTHIHNLLIICAVKDLLREALVMRFPTLNDVRRLCDWIAYGDDGLFWLKNPGMSDIINGETIALKLLDYGYRVADPRGKTELPARFIQPHEAEFLKQNPYWDHHLKMPLWKRNLSCLHSSFNYYTGPDSTESLDTTFLMLFPHGQFLFEECRKKLNDFLATTKLGIVYQKSWNEFLSEYRISLHGVWVNKQHAIDLGLVQE